jgi:hypothetical protein
MALKYYRIIRIEEVRVVATNKTYGVLKTQRDLRADLAECVRKRKNRCSRLSSNP